MSMKERVGDVMVYTCDRCGSTTGESRMAGWTEMVTHLITTRDMWVRHLCPKCLEGLNGLFDEEVSDGE